MSKFEIIFTISDSLVGSRNLKFFAGIFRISDSFMRSLHTNILVDLTLEASQLDRARNCNEIWSKF
jgi:hypothetical protein